MKIDRSTNHATATVSYTLPSGFIPSPYRVVTEYEWEFVQAWLNVTADSVTEMLQYIDKVRKDNNKK